MTTTTARLRPCLFTRCPILVVSGYCPKHSGPAKARIRGRRLQRLRANLFAEHPLCVLCLPHRVTAATIRDHVIPLEDGGPDDETNVQAICPDCHDAKSLEESARRV